MNFAVIKKLFAGHYQKAFLHLYSPKYLPLALLLKILGLPVVTTVYGVWFLESRSQTPETSPVKTWWLKIGQGLILLLSDKLIVFSTYENNLIQKHFGFAARKLVTIPGGVDLKTFQPVSQNQKNQLRQTLHLPVQSQIFLILSRLEKRKGITTAIKAFAQLAKTRPEIFLCIVFPSGKFNYLESIDEAFAAVTTTGVGENIHFVTGVDSANIPLYFQASDFFLMSSVDLETFGLTTLEAAACGCLPLGFKSGATPELLNQISPKLIASPVNSQALAKKLGWLLSLPPSQKSQLQQRAWQLADRYQWQKIAPALHKILSWQIKLLF